MDKPLGGFTQQLFEVCMQPMVKAMETMWNSICCHTGIAAPSSSPLALTPRLVREVLFRAMGALDRKAYSDAMSRPYLGAISSVLGPLLPILEKTVHDRIFADVVGQRPTLRNKYACVMNMLLSFRYRDGGSVGFPGTPGSQGGEFTWAMTTAEMFKFKVCFCLHVCLFIYLFTPKLFVMDFYFPTHTHTHSGRHDDDWSVYWRRAIPCAGVH